MSKTGKANNTVLESIIRGSIVCVVMMPLLNLIIAAFVAGGRIPEEQAEIYVNIACGLSGISGGLFGAEMSRRKLLISGGGAGLISAVIIIMSKLISGGIYRASDCLGALMLITGGVCGAVLSAVIHKKR